jgi:DoxX-like family
MNKGLAKVAIPILRWTLGVVVLLESIHATLSPSAAHHFAKMGIPAWAGRTLGGTEIAAAILFLVPISSAIGGYLLLATFAVAATIHLLHGESDVGGLLVYAAAVIACIAHKNPASGDSRDDG